MAYGVLPDGQPLAILEPLTEGRLAGSLARRGEGPAATWTRAAESCAGPTPRTATRARSASSASQPGSPAHGPFSLLIEDEPGTIHG